MTTTTASVIYLGNFGTGIPNIDQNGTGSAETAGALVGETFTSATMEMTNVTYNDNNSDGSLHFDGGNGDNISFDRGAGTVTENVNQAVWYDVTFTLADGSTVNTDALVFQTSGGETFLTEFSAQFDNLAIESIEITGVLNNLFGAMLTNNSVTGTTIVCFAEGTRVTCANGLRRVEDLKPGDLVHTVDHGLRPIRKVIVNEEGGKDDNAPIVFQPGSIGPDMPQHTLRLSPQHRVLCRSKLVERMFGTAEVFLPAKRFVGARGISQEKTGQTVSYYHLELAAHEVLVAEGAFVESCLMGTQTRKTLGLFGIAPPSVAVAPCRPIPKGHKQKQFVARLIKNRRQIHDAQIADRLAA